MPINDMDKTDWKLYEIFLLGCLIVAYSLGCWVLEDKFFVVKFWSWAMLLLIYAFLRLQKQILLFAPLNLFCLFYITIPITNFYYIATDFATAEYLDKNSLRHNYIYLFDMSAFYYFVGLAAILLGYSILKKPAYKPIIFESNSTLNPSILKFLVLGMLLIGVFNFSYNVFSSAGGNIFSYLATVAVRKDEFQESGGTTIGYNFYYMASYLLVFSYLRKGKKVNLFLIGVIAVGFLLKASNGRIYGTLAYLLSFIAIYYFYNFLKTGKTNNKKVFAYLAPLPLLGVAFYFLRLLSSIQIGGVGSLVKGDFWELAQGFLNVLGYYAIDKGNTPNVAVFMKIIDAWQTDHGYLYGQSLLSGIMNSLPHDAKSGGFAITSNMVRTLWYPHVEGGALPTTAVGEMYMNFGPVGPFIGMFFVGFLIRLWYNFVIKSRNYWQYLIFLIISLVFVAIYAKVDFTNLGLFDPVVVFFPLAILWLLSALVKVKIPDSALIKRQLNNDV